MEFKLNETQQTAVDTSRDFAERFIKGRIEEIEIVGKFPEDLYKQMVDTGLLAFAFEEQYGGLEMGYDCFAMAIEQIAKVSASAATALLISILPLEAINLFGTEEQKQKHISEGLSGKTRGSFAFTEPGTGSDPKQLLTTGKREGDYFIVNGVKRFISNAAYNGPIVVFVKDSNTDACTALIMDKFCEGYSISTSWDKIGLKGSAVYDIFLDNVKIPVSNVLGKEGDGYNILLKTTAYGKLGFSSCFLGVMAASFDNAVKYVKEKEHRGASIGKFQAVQLKIAQIAAKYESCRYLVYKCGEDANDHSNTDFAAESAMVKGHVSDTGVEAAVLAMNVMGAYGVMDEYNQERYLRDALIGPHIEGASDIQRLISVNKILRG